MRRCDNHPSPNPLPQGERGLSAPPSLPGKGVGGLGSARPAFTLIELLVAMAVIVVLASIALLVVPDIMDKDRTTDGASSVRQWLMIAKARAGRDQASRGLRLVTGLDPNNPAKTNPLFVTECQYIEQPPPYRPNPSGSSGPSDPYVVFLYTVNANGMLSPPPVCQIRNLTYLDALQVQPNSWLSVSGLNGFGAWIKTVTPSPVPTTPNQTTQPTTPPTNPTRYTLTVQLTQYPSGDSDLGAAGVNNSVTAVYVSYSFSISLQPRPLLGEPPMLLPKNICIDLTPNVSYPPGQLNPFPPPTTLDYDILFTPTGHVRPGTTGGGLADGQIYLWVRDYTKVADMTPATTTPAWTYNPAKQQFELGGEQQLVALKARSGALGVFPVMWPNAAGGYATGQSPYYLAQQGASAP